MPGSDTSPAEAAGQWCEPYMEQFAHGMPPPMLGPCGPALYSPFVQAPLPPAMMLMLPAPAACAPPMMQLAPPMWRTNLHSSGDEGSAALPNQTRQLNALHCVAVSQKSLCLGGHCPSAHPQHSPL